MVAALFDAVEHQDYDKVKDMLDSNGLDVNWSVPPLLSLRKYNFYEVLSLIGCLYNE